MENLVVTLGSYHTSALLLLSLILSSYLFSWAGPSILHHMIEKSSSASNLRTRGIFTLKAYRYLVINIFAHGHNHIREKNASKEKSEGKRNAMEKINIHPKKKNSGYQCRFVMVTHYLSNMICFFFFVDYRNVQCSFSNGREGREGVGYADMRFPHLTSLDLDLASKSQWLHLQEQGYH